MSASACAKFILGGEHSIVSRGWALAFPLPKLRLEVIPNSRSYNDSLTKLLDLWKIDGQASYDIQSEIPQGKGLGSSAALCVAFLKSQGIQDEKKLFELARSGEGLFHGKSSGLDPMVIIQEKAIAYNSKSTEVRFLNLDKFNDEELSFFLIDSGQSHNTQAIIEKLSSYQKIDPTLWNYKMNQLAFNAEAMWTAIEKKPRETLATLMLQSHQVLAHLGLSTPRIDEIISHLMKNCGVLGAKLTGAGAGGFVLALAPLNRKEDILKAYPETIIY